MTRRHVPPSDIQTPDEPVGISILDKTDPRSLINLVPEFLVQDIERIPPEWLNQDEQDLIPLVFAGRPKTTHAGANRPTATECRIRMNFWLEYTRAQSTMSRMVMKNVYAGACSQGLWAQLCGQKNILAFILCIPHDYMRAMEEMLNMGITEMRKILEYPLEDAQGRFDAKLADVKFKIFQGIEMRLKGSIIQRAEIKTANFHAHQQAPTPGPKSMDELDAKIKNMEERVTKQLPPAAEIVDILTPGGKIKEVSPFSIPGKNDGRGGSE